MKTPRNLAFYLITIGTALGLMYLIYARGIKLEPAGLHKKSLSNFNVQWLDGLHGAFVENFTHPLAILILQVIVIITVCRIFGFLFSRMGQPAVIGEITAGIVLGPSIVGSYLPEWSAFLFPASSIGNLQFLSQFGLILFMFVIGMELDLKLIKNKAQEAVVISHASIVIPFTLGMGLAYYLYSSFAPPGVDFLSFALFIGTAMSITAFPVLARIIQERGLTQTKLGALAITSAATDDVTAWCLLACVVAIVKAGSLISSLFTIAFSIIYVVAMLYLMRPFLRRLGSIYTNKETISKGVIALVFLIMLSSAFATEVIGIHALFGAFLAGVIMPPNLNFRKILIEKVEDVGLVLLLPLFFVFTGLRTEIGLIDSTELLKVCAMVIIVAIGGKFFGSAIAARITGQNWKESLSIGALMNSRGLMELIVLNIGYDLGILNPEMFTMLVIMALFTTFMTGPSLSLINFIWKDRKKSFGNAIPGAYKVLVSFGLASSGRKLLRLAHLMNGKSGSNSYYAAIHITASADMNLLNAADFEADSFRPLRAEADRLGIKVDTHYKMTNEIHREVFQLIDEQYFDLLLVGAGKSLYTGSLLGNLVGVTKALSPEKLIGSLTAGRPLFPANDQIDEKARQFAEQASADVGILLDSEFSGASKIFLPLFEEWDLFLLDYAKRFIVNASSRVSVMDPEGILSRAPRIKSEIAETNYRYTNAITIMHDKAIGKDFLARQDLMLISYEGWKGLINSKSSWIQGLPGTLILKKNR